MNTVNLIGRLTKDPVVRYTNDQMAIARFTLAIDRPPKKDGTKDADFPGIICFGRTAEYCERWLYKGQRVGITGRVQTGSYTNNNGDTVYTTDIVAEKVDPLEWKEQRQERQQESMPSELPPDAYMF